MDRGMLDVGQDYAEFKPSESGSRARRVVVMDRQAWKEVRTYYGTTRSPVPKGMGVAVMVESKAVIGYGPDGAIYGSQWKPEVVPSSRLVMPWSQWKRDQDKKEAEREERFAQQREEAKQKEEWADAIEERFRALGLMNFEMGIGNNRVSFGFHDAEILLGYVEAGKEAMEEDDAE